MPAPSTTTFFAGEPLQRLGPAAVAADGLHVEKERLDHVLRDLAGGEVDEVAPLDLDCAVEVDLGALDRGGHDVRRRRVVGALELLAQVRRERRQVLRQRGRRRACRRGSCSPSRPRAAVASGLAAIHALAAGISSSRVATISSRMPTSLAFAGRSRWPCMSSCMSASTMPSMRTVRTTPPPPGSSPSCTSGKPSCTLGVVDGDAVVAGAARSQGRRRARRR